MFRCRHKIFVFLSVFLFSLNLYSETFRVRKVFPLQISNFTEKSAEIGINDSISVFLPENKQFIEGIELVIQIPKAIADWRDSVAMTVYDNITPTPSESIIDYTGTKRTVSPLPSKMTWIVHIPISQKNSIKNDGYVTKLDVLPDISRNFLFIRFQPAMKGVPEDTYNSNITVTARPILMNKGILNLSVFDSEKNQIDADISIDDEPLNSKGGKILLSPGNHNISIFHEDFRNETRSVVIEQAKITDIAISLKSSEPTVKICAPADAKIFLDDNPFTDTDKEVPISEGEHLVKMQIGGYEVIRNINIIRGKSYNVNLMIDLDISEE